MLIKKHEFWFCDCAAERLNMLCEEHDESPLVSPSPFRQSNVGATAFSQQAAALRHLQSPQQPSPHQWPGPGAAGAKDDAAPASTGGAGAGPGRGRRGSKNRGAAASTASSEAPDDPRRASTGAATNELLFNSSTPPISPNLQYEPAHIAPGSLRSIKSSGSICSMAGGLESLPELAGSPSDTPRGLPSRSSEQSATLSGLPTSSDQNRLTINAFLEDSGQPTQSCMRKIHSAAGRLDQLAEEPSSPRDAYHDDPTCQAGAAVEWNELDITSSCPEKRLQDTPFHSQPAHIAPGTLRSVGSGLGLAALAEEEAGHEGLLGAGRAAAAAGDAGFGTGLGGEAPSFLQLSEMLNSHTIQVKNTFLDFEPKPVSGLRSVATYSGRLADMG